MNFAIAPSWVATKPATVTRTFFTPTSDAKMAKKNASFKALVAPRGRIPPCRATFFSSFAWASEYGA